MTHPAADPFDLASGVPSIAGEIRPKPKFSDRISKRVLVVGFLFIAALVLIFMAGISQIGENKPPTPVAVKKVEDKDDKGIGSSPGAELTEKPKIVPLNDQVDVEVTKPDTDIGGQTGKSPVVPNKSVIPEVNGKPEMKNGKAVATIIPPTNVPPIGGGSGQIPKQDTVNPGANSAPLTPQQQAELQAKQDRMARLAQARSKGLSAQPFDGDGAASNGAAAEVSSMKTALLEAAKNSGAGRGQLDAGQAQRAPVGEQDEKLQFLKDSSKEERGYHPNLPQPAVSPNEVKVGSFIPLILETGINSDLPGQITARASESVYDSVSGCRELIPAMTKFVGRYDSKVALGQGRILVAWNSAIFPDGSELNLAGMQGYDSAGQAGLQSDVDNHYLRMFGFAFGMSMVTAGVALSVPPPNPSVNGAAASPSVSQVIATALAQQYGQLGAQMMGKHLAVQPTLRNYPGERFTIMVPHTVVFNKAWSNRCGG